LFDETAAHNQDSTSAVATEAEPTMEQQQPEQNQSADTNEPVDTQAASAAEDKAVPAEDFASVLETFTTEAEEAISEDRVIKGTVLKLTPTHVVVDIGAKSEGMLPLAEVLDHEGKPKFQPGDEIQVMRSKGEAEEGYINLSFQKAQRIHAWEEIEKAYTEKKPIKAVVIDRIKGGLTVDIHGAISTA
jgi:small subunit ribosomal protein S1